MKRMTLMTIAALMLSNVAFADERKDIADRIDRHGDRYHNGGNDKGEKAAREASKDAREAKSVEKAREVERDFNSGRR